MAGDGEDGTGIGSEIDFHEWCEERVVIIEIEIVAKSDSVIEKRSCQECSGFAGIAEETEKTASKNPHS